MIGPLLSLKPKPWNLFLVVAKWPQFARARRFKQAIIRVKLLIGTSSRRHTCLLTLSTQTVSRGVKAYLPLGLRANADSFAPLVKAYLPLMLP